MPNPDFMIVGAMKAGTTVLAAFLRRHPDIDMLKGEPHQFDKGSMTDSIEKYLACFDPAAKMRGEKTPRYAADPIAMVHIATLFPNIKIIFVLRDPVHRFASHCRHWNRLIKAPKYMGMRKFWDRRAGQDAKWRGMYHVQLQLMWSLFPQENVCVVFSEDMRENPAGVLHDVQKFLGVELLAMKNNPPKDKPVNNDAVFQKLVDLYAPCNEQLYKMLEGTAATFRRKRIQQWTG